MQDGLSSDTVSGHPCLNVMHGLGISKVRFDVRPRTTAGIARFYEKYFGARIMLLYIDGCSSCRSVAHSVDLWPTSTAHC